MFRTDSPIADAERYQHYLESRAHIICERCGRKIFKEDSLHDGDIYYEIDDEIVCEDCISAVVKEHERRYA